MKKYILFALLFLLQNKTQAQTAYFNKIKTENIASFPNITWRNIAPGTSGYCEEFWVHPTDNNTMFMGPDMHAAFGTWDNAASWQTIKDADGNGMDMRRVIDIQFSLQNPNFGLAFSNNQTGSTTSGEIYETSDKGKTWKVNSNMGKCHSKLAIHPTNDNIWFLGAGDFWNVKENHRTLADPNGLIISRSSYGYVWKTSNKGLTWKKVANTIASNLDVGRILFHPTQPNIMIMATGHGMFRSTDTGETWTASATGLPNNLPRDLTSYYNATTGQFILYTVEQTVYTANGNTINSNGGVFKSIDNGQTWQNATGNLGINLQTITDYWARDGYHKSVSYWLGISKASSQSTYNSYPTNALSVYNRIVVNPKNPNEIYLGHNKKHDFGFGPGDIWKTEDGGVTWFPCTRSGSYWLAETNKSYWQTKNSNVAANVKFAHLQPEMDHGNESAGTRMLTINSNGEIFTNIDQQLLKSSNGGTSWEQIDDNETSVGSNKWVGKGGTALPGRFMLLETGIAGRKLLCSGEHGLWQTTDKGSYSDPEAIAVQQLEGQNNDGGAHSISTVAVHPNNPDIIYFLSWRQEHRGKLRKSIDGGATWTNISTIFESNNGSWENLAYQYNLIIDPVTPNNMYFCSIRKEVSDIGISVDESVLTKGGYGFYKSTDGGLNWALSNTGLPATGSVRRIAMHPDNPQIIYAAINQWGNNDPGGLYKSINGGNSWTMVTIPAVIKSVNHIFIDRNTKHIFISTGARSGTLDSGGVWRSIDNGANWERIFEAPYIWQTEVSPVNSNIILISAAVQVPNLVNSFKNPGVYLSKDAGANWIKINKGLAHSDRIVDLKPDPVDQTLLWCAGWGSGWYQAKFDKDDLSKKSFSTVLPQIDLYPNPIINGILNLTNIPDNTRYSISDIQGRNIKSEQILDNKSVDVSHLKSGVYLLRIATPIGVAMRKFIVR